MQILKLIVKTYLPQWKPTPEGATVLCPTALREGDRSDLPPRLAVVGPAGCKENGLTLLLSDVNYRKVSNLSNSDKDSLSLPGPGFIARG